MFSDHSGRRDNTYHSKTAPPATTSLLIMIQSGPSFPPRPPCFIRVCVCSALGGSHVIGGNRRHLGTLGTARVGRAVWCACGAVTCPKAPEYYSTTSLTAHLSRRTKSSAEPQHQLQSTKHTVLWSVLQLHPSNAPPHIVTRPATYTAVASRSHGIAT